jgi:hypothetical protein
MLKSLVKYNTPLIDTWLSGSMSVQPRVPAMVVATEGVDVQDDEEEGHVSRNDTFNVCLNSQVPSQSACKRQHAPSGQSHVHQGAMSTIVISNQESGCVA